MNWVRTNVIIVVSLTLIVLALIAFYWPIHTERAAFHEKVSSRQQQLSSIQQLQRASVSIPPAQIDAPPRDVNLVVNQAAIEKLGTLYGQMNEEYKGVFQRATEINRYGHDVMLQGLFPDPINENSKPFQARRAYLQAFEKLYASMDAGTPPDAMEIETLLARASEMTQRNLMASGSRNQTPQQQEEARQRQVDQLIRRYQQSALEHHVYAEPPQTNPSQLQSRNQSRNPRDMSVFQIGQWARSTSSNSSRGNGNSRSMGNKPNMLEIWEGQLQLWIQQDLVTAIRIANEVDNPDVSLVRMPIKRVLSMTVEPDYVGAPPPPVLGEEGSSSTTTSTSGGGGGSQDPSQPIERDFTESATGRATNAMYDVRHANLSIIVDSQKIPKVINAIHSVNFMTVIGMDMTEVDEYEALQEGYFYGEEDVVQLDLKVETLWLRSWTAGDVSREQAQEEGHEFYAGLMPDLVRYRLGLPARNPEELQKDLENVQTLVPGGEGQYGRGGYGPGMGGMMMPMRGR